MNELTLPLAGATAAPRSRPDAARLAMWASLLPITLLMRPYGGLIQDALIYVGRGVADLDPDGVGRDLMFTHDGQSSFSVVRPLVHLMLTALPPGVAAMLLALAGLLLWVSSAAALARSLAPERVAWAMVVAMLVLPGQYGAFGVFSYADAIATPRVFAQAGVLAGLAALVSGRRRLGLALLAAAAVVHPLIALPGLGLGLVLLLHDDRRWLVGLALGCALLGLAAALKLPLLDRLGTAVDPEWMAILQQRSRYLFPSLWPRASFGPVAAQLTAVALAGSLAPGRARALFWGVAALAVAGLAGSLLLGDLIPNLLVTQLQLWRALWLLAVLGNAAALLAAAGLWCRGQAGRITLALLALTWLVSAQAPLAVALGVATIGFHGLERRGGVPALPRRVLHVAAVAVAGIALAQALQVLTVLTLYLQSAAAQGGEARWSFVVKSDAVAIPGFALVAALTLRPWRGRVPGGRAAAVAGLLAVSLAGGLLWDGRTDESRLAESAADAGTVRRLIGPARGEVMWVDDYSEAWLVAGRPSFLNPIQAGPMLFSRDLAVAWQERAERLRRLGLVRASDMTPWAEIPRDADEIVLTATALRSLCDGPGRPAAIVAPGRQEGAAPAGWFAALWRPSRPIHRLSADDAGLHWRSIDVFTVVRCPPNDGLAGVPHA